jgi:hypothetical protein
MRTQLIVHLLSLSVPLRALTTVWGLGIAEKAVAAPPVENQDPAHSKEKKGVVPATVDLSPEARRILIQLRGKLPNKTDDEIIRVVRGYASADRFAGASGMKWFTDSLQRARKQREAMTAFGDCCTYAESGNGTSAPPWLTSILGDDFFRNVDTVDVGQGAPTDAELEHLRALPQLRVLRLSGCFPKNTDNGLKVLEGLTHL